MKVKGVRNVSEMISMEKVAQHGAELIITLT